MKLGRACPWRPILDFHSKLGARAFPKSVGTDFSAQTKNTKMNVARAYEAVVQRSCSACQDLGLRAETLTLATVLAIFLIFFMASSECS